MEGWVGSAWVWVVFCFVFSLFVLFVCCGGFGVFYSVGLNLITKLTMRVKIAKWRSLSYLAAFSKTHHNHVFSPWGRCCARATTSPGAPSWHAAKIFTRSSAGDNVIYPPSHICSKLVKKEMLLWQKCCLDTDRAIKEAEPSVFSHK